MNRQFKHANAVDALLCALVTMAGGAGLAWIAWAMVYLRVP